MTRFLGLLIALLALPVQADIYKCRLANGRTEISNAPCPAGSGTLTARPDDPVSEQSRQQAERDVERMRSFVEKREATQRTEEAAERQSTARQRVYQSTSMSECLRELELNPVEPARQAELEAICRAKAKSEPTLVPVPVYGGVGSPVDACIRSVMRLRLAPAEQDRRLAQCQGHTGHIVQSHPLPEPQPSAKPQPNTKSASPCPRNDKFCLR